MRTDDEDKGYSLTGVVCSLTPKRLLRFQFLEDTNQYQLPLSLTEETADDVVWWMRVHRAPASWCQPLSRLSRITDPFESWGKCE